MEQNLVVLQGKVFTVDLQSMFGSTNYGWCVTSLPSGIILMAADNIKSSSDGSSPVTQRFYFGVVSSEVINVDIQFALICWSDFTKSADSCTAHVRIVPSDSGNYTPYSENPSLKYGFPCQQVGAANAAMPYGMIYNGNGVGANTPIFGNNVGASTPIFGNNVGASTPIFGNNVGASTPIFGNNVGASTPIFGNNVGAGTPIFGNNVGAGTPIFGNNVPVVDYGIPPVLKYGFPGCC